MAQVFDRDEDGNVTNPPVNPLFEQELTRARDAADDAQIAYVQGEYDSWRADEVGRIESDANKSDDTASDAVNAGPTPGAEPNGDPAPVDPAPAPETPAQTPDQTAGA